MAWDTTRTSADCARCRDPYVAFHHGASDAPGLATLPEAFRTTVLPLLRSRPWREVRQALSLYWALDLGRDDELRALVVRLLSVASAHGLGWCRFLPPLASERRTKFIRLLLMSGAGARAPEDLRPSDFEPLAGRTDDCYEDRVWRLFEAVGERVPIAHVREGFYIADRFVETYRFSRPWDCGE